MINLYFLTSGSNKILAGVVSVKGAERVTIEEHARILKAIASGDPAAAAAAMSDHLSRASSLYAQFATPEPGDNGGRAG